MQNVKAKSRPAKAKAAPNAAPATESTLPAVIPGAPVASELPANAAPATESKPSAADKRAAYVAESATAKAVFSTLAASVSIPVKPASGFKAKPLSPKAYNLTERGAAAIYCAVAASGKPFADGETYSRRFNIGGVPYLIENGAFSDFIGTAYTVDSTGGNGGESFTLLPGAVAAIRSKLGAKIAAFKI